MTHNGPARTAAAIALVALMGAGCSNAPAETAATPTRTPNPELTAKLTELARCMRANGVTDFPDPGADGSVQYLGDSPELKTAGEKCHDIVPGKGNG